MKPRQASACSAEGNLIADELNPLSCGWSWQCSWLDLIQSTCPVKLCSGIFIRPLRPFDQVPASNTTWLKYVIRAGLSVRWSIPAYPCKASSFRDNLWGGGFFSFFSESYFYCGEPAWTLNGGGSFFFFSWEQSSRHFAFKSTWMYSFWAIRR